MRGAVALAGVVLLTLFACKKPEQVIQPETGMSTKATAHAAIDPDAAFAKRILTAERVARPNNDDVQFVRAFDTAFIQQAGKAAPPTDKSVGTPEYYANTRDLLDLSIEEAKAVEAGARFRLGISVLRGRPALPSEHPECVAVGTGPGEWTCSGTLIGPNAVVTAGHCLEKAIAAKKNLTHVFFGTDISKPGTIVTGSPVPHPSYVTNGRKNDIVILVLAAPVTAVPFAPIARGALVDGSKSVREVGFGKTSLTGPYAGTRQLLDVPLASKRCANPGPALYGCNSGLEFVAKPATSEPAGVCHGDSGGPAYVQAGAGWSIAGLTSRPAKGVSQQCGGAAVFVRLDQYEGWIRGIPGVILN